MIRFAISIALSLATTTWATASEVRSVDGERVLQATGLLAGPSSSNAESAARLYVSAHAADFAFSRRVTLVARSAPAAGLPGPVRFERRIDGLPVFNGGMNVLLGADRSVLGVVAADVPPPSGAFLLTAADATARASAAMPGSSAVPGDAEEGWWSTGTSARPAYRVLTRTFGPTGIWAAIIDGADGRVLFIQELLTRSTGRVYDLSPVQPTPDSRCPLDGSGLYEPCAPAVLRTLGHLTGTPSLTGTYTSAWNCRGNQYPVAQGDTTGCDQLPAPTADVYDFAPDLTGASASDDFAAVMAYHHVDRFLSSLLSMDGTLASSLYHLPVFVNAYDAGEPYGNAHFNPLARNVVLGQADGVDFSYDASVIYHELSHAVVSMLGGFHSALDAHGVLEEPWAVDEGNADALASTHTGLPGIGYYLGNRISRGHPEALRNMSNRKTCRGTGTVTPQLGVSGGLDGIDGEVHDDGEIWNGFFWELRSGLKDVPACEGACDAATAIEYDTMKSAAGTSPTLGSMAQLAVSVSQALFPDFPNLNAFVQCVAERHDMAGCDRTFPMYAGEAKLQYVRYRYGGFQFAVQATGRTQAVVCIIRGQPGDVWVRLGQPVALVSPALSGPTTVSGAAPKTFGPFAVAPCSSGGTLLTIVPGTTTVFYLLFDSVASTTSTPSIFGVETSTSGMAARPPVAPPTCAYVGERPVVTSFAPAEGSAAGGTSVVIAGSHFESGVSVTVGGATAGITASSATSLTVTTPPHAVGAADVVVTNGNGLSATATGSFTFLVPAPAEGAGGGVGAGGGGGGCTSGASLAPLAILGVLLSSAFRRRRTR